MRATRSPLKGPFRTRSWTKRADLDDVEGRATSQTIADLGVRLLSLQEDIQQRIAADLHDSTCQHLIAASLNVGRLRQATSKNSGTNEICDGIDTSINHALREIRAFAYLLHPQHLLSDGLKTTIEQYVGGFSSRTSLKCTLKITPAVDRLSYEAQRSLFRVIQEALTNVFRHAKAKEVDITIEARKTHFRLRVSDDGCGIPASQTKPGREAFSIGVGIPGMKIRVHQLGGFLEIQSSMVGSHGTALCAEIPYPLLDKDTPERPHRGFGGRALRTINRGGPAGAVGVCRLVTASKGKNENNESVMMVCDPTSEDSHHEADSFSRRS